MSGLPEVGGEESWSDGELISACLENNEPAWAELIRRYERLVRSIASSRGLAGHDSADLNQLVWTQVYLQLSTLRDGDSFRAWLSTLTKNACYHLGRKRQRIRHRETDRYVLSDLEARNAIAPYDPLGAEAQTRLLVAIAELPSRCQILIEQLYFTQPKPTYRQVGELLGVAEGSVSALRDRCLKKLFKLLARDLAA